MTTRHLLIAAALGASACARTGEGGATIAVTRFVTLGTHDGPGALASTPFVSQRLPGNRWVAWVLGRQEEAPSVFDSAGRYVGPLGSVGRGPGEFQDIGAISAWPGESAVVLGPGRATLLDRSLKPGRTFTIPVPFPQAVSVLQNGWSVFPAGSGAPPHETQVLGPDGVRRFAFGAEDTAVMSLRSTAIGAGSTIWVAERLHRLMVDQWDTTGHRLRHFELDRDWFPSYREYQGIGHDKPPSPSLAGFWVDSLDRLWLVAWVPDPKWADAKGSYKAVEYGTKFWAPDDPSAVRDEIVEVTDLKTGKVIASRRFDALIGWVVEPGIVAQPRQDADGWWFVDLSKVELR